MHDCLALQLGCTALPLSARDPTLSPFIAFATMSKTPFSADYIHKLLKTLPASEKEKFLEMLADQPVIDQHASSEAGPKASASQLSPPAAMPQTPPEFCDTVAQEAYTQPAPQAMPSATPKPTAPAPQPGPAVAAAKPVGPAVAAAKPGGTAAFQDGGTEAAASEARGDTRCRPRIRPRRSPKKKLRLPR